MATIDGEFGKALAKKLLDDFKREGKDLWDRLGDRYRESVAAALTHAARLQAAEMLGVDTSREWPHVAATLASLELTLAIETRQTILRVLKRSGEHLLKIATGIAGKALKLD